MYGTSEPDSLLIDPHNLVDGEHLLGSQEPTFKWVTPYVRSWGPDAVEQWESASGKVMDTYQRTYMGDILGIDERGIYANDQTLIILGRQNGKGDIIECREMAAVTFLEERVVMHSAHEFKTSREAFLRMLELCERSPDLKRRIVEVAKSKGQEGITFRGPKGREITGRCRLLYVARSGGSGRGFVGDVNIMDEAMILDQDSISSMSPTMSAKRNPQLLFFGSAGARTMRSGSEVMARVRRAAYAKQPGVCAYLWEGKGKQSVTWSRDRLKPETWARMNPAYNRPGDGAAISERSMRRDLINMTPDDFDREHLGVGDWPSEEGWQVMPQDHWTSGLFDAESKCLQPVALGIEMPPDLSRVSITVGGLREDGLFHTERIPGEVRLGYDWAVEYIAELCIRQQIGIIVVDPRSPANVIIEDLKRVKPRAIAGIYEASPLEVCTWSAQWLTAAVEMCAIRHIGQASMEKAVGGAVKQDVGDGMWKWSRTRSDVDISPLYGSTLAWGGVKIGWKKRRISIASV